MSSDFKVGDEVVCVTVEEFPHVQYTAESRAFLKKLEVNKTYVIASIRPALFVQGHTVICFNELPYYDSGLLYGYDARRFRKVQKKFTGMSVLRTLLITTKESVDV